MSKVYAIITEEIIKRLEQGTVPWRRPWRTNHAGLPSANLVSGRAYRGINVFLLGSAGFENPFWLTFKQSKQLGGHVRKGERGHINYVDSDKGKGANFYRGDKPIKAKAKIAWINIGDVELELIEPRDEHSVYAEFLRDKGPGIHHVMFATADYDSCVKRMTDNQIGTLGGGELQHTRFQMFDTQTDLGLICEIAEGDPLIPDESL